MNKLKLLMKNNEDVIYDCEIQYVFNNDDISFTYDNVIYKINSSKTTLYFERETEEEVFVIEARENGYKSYVILKNDNLRFDIDFESFKHSHSENSIDFEYNLRGDEEVLRKVKIQLI